MSQWTDHVERWRNCQRCPLAQQRDRICLGRGTVPCDVLFVGEAPGASEDAVGLPFVGPAGHLMDQIVRRALGGIPLCAECGRLRYREVMSGSNQVDWTCGAGHQRDRGYGGRDVTCAFNNLVACFPREAKQRGENEPENGEIKECRPRLAEFVNLARPRLIVCVGKLATYHVDHSDTVPCADVMHPAWILRQVLAKQQSEVHNAEVIIARATEKALEDAPEFREWGTKHAKRESKRRQEYDIPF